MTLRLALAAVVLMTSLCGLSANSSADESVYLVGAELHVGDGRVIADSVVELRGEFIAAVSGPEGRDQIPRGGRVIDLKDRLLTPGLISASSALGLIEIAGEKSTRDDIRQKPDPIRASYDPAPAFNPDSSLLPVQAVEGVTTAAVRPSGGLLAGQVLWLDLLPPKAEASIVRRRIAVRGTLNRQVGGSRAASLTALRRSLRDAAFLKRNRSRHDHRELRDLVAHPADLEALWPLLAGEVPLVMHANAASDIRALIELAREFEIRLVIEGGAEGWRVAPELAGAGVAVILSPSANTPRDLSSVGARLENAALLSAAGVEIAINEAGGAHNLRNLTQEAGIAVAYGLDWEKALTALTLAPARIYGMQALYGSVEPGKVASLVVWDADPFELSSSARRVFVRGREISRRTRQTLLRDRYRDRAAAGP